MFLSLIWGLNRSSAQQNCCCCLYHQLLLCLISPLIIFHEGLITWNHVYWKIFIFNWTTLTTFSFPEYCFIHKYWVPPHKSLISAWTSSLFFVLVCFDFLIYLFDVYQICISTSCSCTFNLKFYLEAYMYFIRILNLLCLLHMVLKNYMLIIQVFYSLCLFSIEIQMNPLIYC